MSRVYAELETAAINTLNHNDRQTHTIAQAGNYPHQWLWDSCFIANGILHLDPHRAATEINTLLEAQWVNGMVPHMRFTTEWQGKKNYDYLLWHSSKIHGSPENIATSCITQPPVIADACWRIVQSFETKAESTEFLQRVVPKLAEYHGWLMNGRDYDGTKLFTAIHPYEIGRDNTPPWKQYATSKYSSLSKSISNAEEPLNYIASHLRRDVKESGTSERVELSYGVVCLAALAGLRRQKYDWERIKANYGILIQDVGINSVLVRNNQILLEMAEEIGHPLDETLVSDMAKCQESFLNQLWCEPKGLFLNRDPRTRDFLPEESIDNLLPLYSGALDKQRTQQLISSLLLNTNKYDTPYPVASAPIDSSHFDEDRFWTGPSWVNTNWLIIDGLNRSGYPDLAEKISESTIKMALNGMYEYFSTFSGKGLGVPEFSWTAALVLDLLKRRK